MKSVIELSRSQWDREKYIFYFHFRAPLYVCTTGVILKGVRKLYTTVLTKVTKSRLYVDVLPVLLGNMSVLPVINVSVTSKPSSIQS